MREWWNSWNKKCWASWVKVKVELQCGWAWQLLWSLNTPVNHHGHVLFTPHPNCAPPPPPEGARESGVEVKRLPMKPLCSYLTPAHGWHKKISSHHTYNSSSAYITSRVRNFPVHSRLRRGKSEMNTETPTTYMSFFNSSWHDWTLFLVNMCPTSIPVHWNN